MYHDMAIYQYIVASLLSSVDCSILNGKQLTNHIVLVDTKVQLWYHDTEYCSIDIIVQL